MPSTANAPDRSTYFGSSDAAAILGVSPWKTAYQVWEAKVYKVTEEPDEARARILKRGTMLEPYIIQLLAEDHELWITSRGKRYSDPEYPWMKAEIDAESEDFEGEIDNVEIKSVSPFAAKDWGEAGTDEIPTYYMAQVQYALMVTGRKKTIVAALIGSDDLRLYYVPRDEQIIAHIRAEVVRFWNDHVLTETPPELKTGDDADKWLARFNGATLVADDAVLRKLHELKEVNRQIKEAEALKEGITDALKVALAGGIPNLTVSPEPAAIVDAAGKALLTWNEQSATRLDAKAVKAKDESLYNLCTKTSTFRVLRLKEKAL